MQEDTAFKRWLDRHSLTIRGAAEILGCSPATVQAWRKKEPPRYVLLACAAYSVGMAPIR